MTFPTLTISQAAVKAGEIITVFVEFSSVVENLDATQFVVYDAATGLVSNSAAVLWLTALRNDNEGKNNGAEYDGNSSNPCTRYWRMTLTARADVDFAQVCLGVNTTGMQNPDGRINDPTIYKSNSVFIDSVAPAVNSAVAVGTRLVLSYSDGSGLDSTHPPAASAFSVTAGGIANRVTAVLVDTSTNTVTLTLASAVSAGQTVLVSYTDPTAEDDADAVQDRAGNDAASFSNRVVTVSSDNTAPTMAAGNAIGFSKTAIKSGETTTVTFTFSEAVRGFDLADVLVPANCTLGKPVAVNPTDGASTTWTATLTGKGNVNASDVTLSVNLSGVTDTAGNTGSGSATSRAISVDTRLPALLAEGGIQFNKSTLKTGETAEVLFTFTENVNSASFTADDVVLSGKLAGWTISNPVALDGANASSTFRATLTPPANTESASTTIAVRLDQVSDGGHTGEGSSPASSPVSANTTRPTLEISDIVIADLDLTVNETSTVTFTFSQAVSGFDTDDVSVEKGTLSNMQALDSSGHAISGANPVSNKWSATLTPDNNVSDTYNALTVDMSGVRNAGGNTGTGFVESAYYSVHTQRPSLTGVEFSDTALTIGETATVTFSFSEAVTGFGINDVTVSNGTLSNLVAVDTSGSAITGGSAASSSNWRATLTPATGVHSLQNKLTVDLTGVANAAGVAGAGKAESNNYSVDTGPPTPVDTEPPTLAAVDAVHFDKTTLKTGETATEVTFTFSETVRGFNASAVSGYAANATLTNVRAIDSNGSTVAGDNPASRTWRATLTAVDGKQSAANALTVDLGKVTDAAGNPGVGSASSGNFVVDTLAPTVTSFTVVRSQSAAGLIATYQVQLVFSEKVSGLTANKLLADNASISNLASSDNGMTWTATLAAENNVEDSSNKVHLDLGGVTDAAGNAFAQASAESNNYAVNTQRPRLTGVEFSDAALSIGETTTVTFTFSEAVTGFGINDVAVSNGTLSNLVAVDTSGSAITGGSAASSSSWRATLTPAAGVHSLQNKLTVDLAGVANAAGVAGAGSTESANYSVDTEPPTLAAVDAVHFDKTTLKTGETATEVTFTFNETVRGFGAGAVSGYAANATLTNVRAIYSNGSTVPGDNPSSRTWRATLTAVDGKQSAANALTVDLGKVTDTAGNPGTGSASSGNFVVDTLAPTVTSFGVVRSQSDGLIATYQVQLVFSEQVSGLTANKLLADNASISNLASSDNGMTWTATLTAKPDVQDSSNKVHLDLGGVTDAAGNRFANASAESDNYALDSQAPVFERATVDGNRLVLYYGAGAGLGAANKAGVGAFAVRADGVTNSVTAVSVDAAAGTVTLNLANSVTYGQTVTVSYTDPTAGDDANAVQDEAGNDAASLGNRAVSNNTVAAPSPSPSPAPDTTAPTLTSIVVAPASLRAGQSATVTFTFSEAVTGFAADDVSVANASLGALTSSAGGTVWSATLTPAANIEDASNQITVKLAGVRDLANNQGTDSGTASNNYSVDTVAPAISTATVNGNQLVLTYTEGLGLDAEHKAAASDFTVMVNGRANAVTAVAVNGAAKTVTLTLSTAVTQGQTVTVGYTDPSTGDDANAVQDTAGNDAAGITGRTVSNNTAALAATAPTLTSIAVAPASLKIGQTATVTFTFSQAVTGFTKDDVSAPGGTLSGLESNDGGTTWSATLTPAVNTETAGNAITVNLAGVNGSAGNAGSGTSTASNNYSVDTVAPAISTATVNDSQLVLTYTEGLGLDAEHKAAASDFTVMVNGTANAVTAVSVNGAAKTVTLSLANSVTYGQTVTVSYTDPTDGDDVNAIQDTAGNDAASLTAQTAANSTPSPGQPAQSASPAPLPAPDTDSDGVANNVEDQAPALAGADKGDDGQGNGNGNGDGNGDGIPDSRQTSVASSSFATGAAKGTSDSSGYTTLVAGGQNGKPAADDGASTHITSLLQQDTPAGLPKALDMPTGLTSFGAKLAAGQASEGFSLYVSADLGVNGYWMKNAGGTWVNLASAAYGGKMVSEGGKLRLDFKITDGGEFDADGLADGSITAQGAAAHMALSVLGQAPDAARDGFWL